MVTGVGIFGAHSPLSRTASAAAADLIRQAIGDGRLEPGHHLKEEQLAQELGISRTPVREALHVLQAEGLIEASPNRGATVRSYDLADLEDLYELRALLEGRAAHRAATRATAAQLVELRASCERFEGLVGASNLQALVAENALFHEAILAAAASERLTGMVRQVVVLPLVYKSYIWYSPEQATASYRYHCELADAIEQRDAQRADLVMREHVEAAHRVLAQHMGGLSEPSDAGGAAA